MTPIIGPKQICAGMSRRASSTSLPRCLGASCSPALISLQGHGMPRKHHSLARSYSSNSYSLSQTGVSIALVRLASSTVSKGL